MSRQSHSHFLIYQNVWCTVSVYHVYWQFYQVPLLLICLEHFRSFFNTQSAIHCAYFLLHDTDGIKTEIAQNKIE